MSFIVAGGALLLALLAGILLDDSGKWPKTRRYIQFDAWRPQAPAADDLPQIALAHPLPSFSAACCSMVKDSRRRHAS